MYYVYMLRCDDNSLYTGITIDVKRRYKEHINKDKERCAKYTLRHNVKSLEVVWKTEDRKLASKLEYHIKKLTKSKKEDLIKNNNLEELLGKKIEANKYERIVVYNFDTENGH